MLAQEKSSITRVAQLHAYIRQAEGEAAQRISHQNNIHSII